MEQVHNRNIGTYVYLLVVVGDTDDEAVIADMAE
jgi:hypothetical protein